MSTVLDSSRITVVADVLSDAARTPCWVATTPEFPGCYGAGATDEAARDQLRASVTSLRAVLARQGRSA
jgi:predicted RNase H-like HicB family nuclease